MIISEKNERIDYLFDSEYKIIQSKDVFSFSIDAVLLAKFVSLPLRKGSIIDLCTGNGAVALMMALRTKAQITGVELQERLADMAKRSVTLNQLDEQVNIICSDIKALPAFDSIHQCDVVTCNPPYFSNQQTVKRNPNPSLAIARHEIHLTLEEAIQVSSQLVRQKGKVAFVHRPERLGEILALMPQYRLFPKRLLFVYPKRGKEANIMLIEATKDGRPGIKVLPPLYIYDEEGCYTKELLTLASHRD
ncbi:hypothetical protein GCM10011391_35980 [Pullulanibacillus camelliae]|uniref:Methyltransferase small domain-containing protein n=1 Tax=Pullulanibacillus camelliae TaxID=1707096 RepID=A0A8J2YM84_9BACL|nr:tRNA1(Val) (adenine(37)-N6)-methyltransferase [Pullulanibacillus camelliae]GGE53904.1 hypothetical protein GCM10011391_35980 [Pullulanibacillus camelliae]